MLLQHIEELQADLRGLAAHETALRGLADAVMNSCNTGGKLLTCGNGGSATAVRQRRFGSGGAAGFWRLHGRSH